MRVLPWISGGFISASCWQRSSSKRKSDESGVSSDCGSCPANLEADENVGSSWSSGQGRSGEKCLDVAPGLTRKYGDATMALVCALRLFFGVLGVSISPACYLADEDERCSKRSYI